MLGGNLNWTPGYTTRAQRTCRPRRSAGSSSSTPTACGPSTPRSPLRLIVSNLDPRDYLTGSTVDGPDITGVPVRETSQTRAPTFLNVQLRLEMKL